MSADDNAPEQAECSCSTCYAGNPECGGCDVCNPAPEQAREVEVLVEQVYERLDPHGHGWAAGDGPTPEEVVPAVLELLVPVRAAEQQEAERRALLEAAGDYVINAYTGPDAYLTPEAREWLRRRADGVTGRSGT